MTKASTLYYYAKIIGVLTDGPLTASELSKALDVKKPPQEHMAYLIKQGEVELVDGVYALPYEETEDALDRWFTGWVRPRRHHVPGNRLCNTITNGIGGWDMRG